MSDIKDLKAKAYDITVQLQILQQKLIEVNQKIVRLESEKE